MVKLGFIRHARTLWNLEKKIQGSTDVPLCSEGVREAHLWGDRLRREKFDLILSSPLIRAQQTAQILSGTMGAKILYDADLREQAFGAWEGRRIMDIRNQAPGEIELQESRGWAFCPPGGEARTMVLKRAAQAVKKAAEQHDNQRILIVTHNSVMKILIYNALDRSFLPGDPPLLQDACLHKLKWAEKMLEIEQLNSIRLI